jgi:hypothetical protein
LLCGRQLCTEEGQRLRAICGKLLKHSRHMRV